MPLHKNEVVFAHVKGYHPWPARVQEVKATSVKVKFFQSNEVNNVPAKQITAVNENTLTKMNEKYGKRDGFTEAIQQMKEYVENDMPQIVASGAESLAIAPQPPLKKSTPVVEKPEPEVSKLQNLVTDDPKDKENINPEEESRSNMDEPVAEKTDNHTKYKPFQVMGCNGKPLMCRIPEKYLLSKPKTPNDVTTSVIDMADNGVDIHMNPSVCGANLDTQSPTKSSVVVADLECDLSAGQASSTSPELKSAVKEPAKLGKRKLSLKEHLINLNKSMAENEPTISIIPMEKTKKAKIQNEEKKKLKRHESKGEKTKGSACKGDKETGKPGNAYVIFFNDNHARVKSENPSMKYKEIATLISKEWATLKQENGSKFLEYHEKYKMKLETYKANKLAKLNIEKEEIGLDKENEATKQVAELLNERDKLKMEIIDLKEKNRELESKNTELKDENVQLKESNSSLKKGKEDAVKAFNQTQKMLLEKLS